MEAGGLETTFDQVWSQVKFWMDWHLARQATAGIVISLPGAMNPYVLSIKDKSMCVRKERMVFMSPTMVIVSLIVSIIKKFELCMEIGW